MTRSIPACLIAGLLLVACTNPDDDDSGSTTQPQTTTLPGITSMPTSSGEDDVGESTAAVDTDTDTDATEPGSTTMELNCGVADIEAKVTIPRVMLVLDKSGSMIKEGSGFWDADGDDADNDGFVDGDPNMAMATPRITRWQSLYETVDFIVGGFEERMDFGATLFPAIEAKGTYTLAACGVHATPDVAIGPDQGAQILATIPPAGTTKIQGGTPAAAGILTGVSGLASDDPADVGRPQYLILVTDGAANCPIEPDDPGNINTSFEDYDSNLPVVVADAFAGDIPTFVVGIDIQDAISITQVDGNPDATNTFEKLNEVAIAGGQPRDGAEKFYNTANQVELQAALMSISELITECTFDLSKPLAKYQYVEKLEVGSDAESPLLYGKTEVADCASESGWQFTDDSKSAIELCGDACALYKQTGDVDIVFQCTAG